MKEISPDLLRDIIDDMDDAVFVVDSDGILRHLNVKACSEVRLPRLTAVGQALNRLLPRDVAALLEEAGNEALATGRSEVLSQQPLILPGRGFLFYDIRVIPYRRPNGDSWVVFLLRDITSHQRRQMSSELARENAEAEAFARRNFLARMSHEIRTPMNGIIGMTDLARQSDSSEDIAEYLEIIKKAADSLLAIINDVLDFSKVESGILELDEKPFCTDCLMNETLTLLKPSADEKGIDLRWEKDEQVPDDLVGDPVRLRQIITNLVGNALKFTENGSVTLRLEPGARSPDGEQDEFVLAGHVVDTGSGIAAEQIPRLFEPFVQSPGNDAGGTGLGLPICRTLARQMGGDVDAESTIGVGSTFHFRVRLKVPSGESGQGDDSPEAGSSNTENGDRMEVGPEKTKTKPRWNGERILLAEDNRVNRVVAERLLEKVGLTVDSREDGEQTVEAWKTTNPDLILMDIQMPVMDGLDAARLIRKIEEEEGLESVPILALTAHVLPEERRIAEEAGMNGWVIKPVSPASLYAELERFLPPVISASEEI